MRKYRFIITYIAILALFSNSLFAQGSLIIESVDNAVIYIDSHRISLSGLGLDTIQIESKKATISCFKRHHDSKQFSVDVSGNDTVYYKYYPNVKKKKFEFFSRSAKSFESSSLLIRSDKKKCSIVIPEWDVAIAKNKDVVHFENCEPGIITITAKYKGITLSRRVSVNKESLVLLYVDFGKDMINVYRQPIGGDEFIEIDKQPMIYTYSDCDTCEVHIDTSFIHSFFIGKTEVTCERYCAFLNLIGCNINFMANGVKYYYPNYRSDNVEYINGFFVPAKGKNRYPITSIPEYAAEAYCKFYGYRLPTIREWQFIACKGNLDISGRAIDSTTYLQPETTINRSFGYDSLCPVSFLKHDSFGLNDIYGNAWEVVTYGDKYYDFDAKSWRYLSLKQMKNNIYNHYFTVGGSYKSAPETLHYSYFNKLILKYNDNDMGFRVAKDL